MATTPEQIRQLATDLDLDADLPADDAALMRAAARALTTLRSVLGWQPDAEQMNNDQTAALADAIALQTVFEAEQGGADYLGVDDRLQVVGGITFAPRPAPRVSRAARETLAGVGLIRRSGTIATPDA